MATLLLDTRHAWHEIPRVKSRTKTIPITPLPSETFVMSRYKFRRGVPRKIAIVPNSADAAGRKTNNKSNDVITSQSALKSEKPTIKHIEMKGVLQMDMGKEMELCRHYNNNSFYSLHMLLRYHSNEMTSSYIQPITKETKKVVIDEPRLVPQRKQSLWHKHSFVEFSKKSLIVPKLLANSKHLSP